MIAAGMVPGSAVSVPEETHWEIREDPETRELMTRVQNAPTEGHLSRPGVSRRLLSGHLIGRASAFEGAGC